jgi:hypothetical protein
LSVRDVTDHSRAVPPCRLTGHRVATALQRSAVRTLGVVEGARRGGARVLKCL